MMTRRTLADDMERSFGSRLLTSQQIAAFTGSSQRTVERGICSYCKPFVPGKVKKYHVTDIAAAMDRYMLNAEVDTH